MPDTIKEQPIPVEVSPEAETAATELVDKKEPKPKKSASKKPKAASRAAKEPVVKIQFAGNEYDLNDVIQKCKKDFISKYNGRVRTIKVYVKPEDNAAYYVVNNKTSDSVEL